MNQFTTTVYRKQSAINNVKIRYGINISKPIRNKFFDQSIPTVEVKLDNKIYCVKLSKSFWVGCPHICFPEFKDWLLNNNIDLQWTTGKAPKVMVTIVEMNKLIVKLI